MKKLGPGLSDTPIPDVTLLTQDELLDLWMANRNSTIAVMASEEIARRLFSQREIDDESDYG